MYGTLTRYTPRTSQAIDQMFNRAIEEFFGGLPASSQEPRPWQPMVDIVETEQAYLLHFELPGLTREDIEMTLENNVLRLSGERKFDQEAQKQTYHRLERAYGAFSRTFTLPTQVAADRVEAAFKDGVLTVTVPKAEQARARKINIG
jgi:HSP20 family protein